ncbi:ATP-binding protein [Pseudomonas moraviensis]|uniref:sensor histidine kinase n=1 Tax=Pseudomonas moraviensis TaxID=321662 RepID=UPI00209255E4|nr:sensor histidine kinase [Pseudomonas moraviensis]UST59639.1 ATP-binding protein [Pseudomonas moraviensis]
MKKIPFNVSARTARLIGRENVSSAEGALIELVKNSYDADANVCVVYFDDMFATLPATTTHEHLEKIIEITKCSELKNCYEKQLFENELIFSEKLYNATFDKDARISLEAKLLSTVTLSILDNGDGMVEEVIENTWMTIGTDNKDQNFSSGYTGRIKSGAKGIGRFALDRLGSGCTLLTKTENSDTVLAWHVNWNDFDQQGVTIDQISAHLGNSDISLIDNLSALDTKDKTLAKTITTNSGTHITVSSLRDLWDRDTIARIYKELETLVPPSEDGRFSIYLFSKSHADLFGEVRSTIYDDYDCKVTATMDEKGLINFEFNRRETDPEKLTEALLQRPYFVDHKITREHLCGETYSYSKTMGELIPGLNDIKEDAHELTGPFKFTLYFLKRQSEKTDIATFLHRNYDSPTRKKWLDNNSGIRIYRDNFRVRPYGEIGKASWDWLGLASRHALDPSALRSGRWRVTPNNISGIISISRIKNHGLQDKSSREGMRENENFQIFTSVIEHIIKEFEQDRSGIYSEIYKYSASLVDTPSDEHLNQVQEADAEIIAQKIFEGIKSTPLKPKNDSDKLAVALLKAKARSKDADDRLVEMKRENSLLRVFASSGLTIAAFTHELDGLNAKLGGRFDNLTETLNTYIEMTVAERLSAPNFKNPFRRIDILRRDDEKIKTWIKYSLRTIRKDKRSRKNLNLDSYFSDLCEEWNSTLTDRQIRISVSIDDTAVSLRAYEIDLDCIFNNLIINSTEAFKRNGFSDSRNIHINVESNDARVVITYSDSGPGLSKDITDPNDIFVANYSTKVNKQGQQIGTGLGMWLVSKTIEEYSGNVEIINSTGFRLRMEINK